MRDEAMMSFIYKLPLIFTFRPATEYEIKPPGNTLCEGEAGPHDYTPIKKPLAELAMDWTAISGLPPAPPSEKEWSKSNTQINTGLTGASFSLRRSAHHVKYERLSRIAWFPNIYAPNDNPLDLPLSPRQQR